MPTLPLKNFLAAVRKPNLRRFALLKAGVNLDWIDSAAVGVLPTVETPSGTIDGVNTDFTITTSTYGLLEVYLNGIRLSLGIGYSLPAPNTIRFSAGYIPQPSGVGGRTINDVIVARIFET